jgi:acyl-CoA thioester hydrolase
MSRIKIDLPGSFSFETTMKVRITDLNYGSHVGNDTVLAYLHEARMEFLDSLGYSELNLEGVGLIMADAAVVFKNEMFYADELYIRVQPVDSSRVGFDLVYSIEKKTGAARLPVVLAKTAMICYDYTSKKMVGLPASAKNKLFP